jgi:hypothetical protein
VMVYFWSSKNKDTRTKTSSQFVMGIHICPLLLARRLSALL